ncbi:MAG: hypothetical protein ACFBZ8_11580 [Opitutales bacterium]
MTSVSDVLLASFTDIFTDFRAIWVVVGGLLLLLPADLLARTFNWSRASTAAAILSLMPVLAILVQIAPWENVDDLEERSRVSFDSDREDAYRERADEAPAEEAPKWVFDEAQATEIETKFRQSYRREFLVNPPEKTAPVPTFVTQAALEAKVYQREFVKAIREWKDGILEDEKAAPLEKARAHLIFGEYTEAAAIAFEAAENDATVWAEAKLFEGDAYMLEGDAEAANFAYNEGLDFPPAPIAELQRRELLLGRAFSARQIGEDKRREDFQRIRQLKKASEDFLEIAELWDAAQLRAQAQSWVYAAKSLTEAGVLEKVEPDVETFQRAIDLYETALSFYPREESENDWAFLNYALGETLVAVVAEDDVSNEATLAGRASEHLGLALEVFTQKKHPALWALCHFRLQVSLAVQAGQSMDPILTEEYLSAALASNELALSVFARRVSPKNWVMLQIKRGQLLRSLALTTPDALDTGIYLRESQIAIRRGLTQLNERTYPEEWAMAQMELGLSYQVAAETFSEEGSLESDIMLEGSVEAFQQALSIYTEETHPQRWALLQAYLGSSYESLGMTIEAQRCFENARRVVPDVDEQISPLRQDEAETLEI